jgi:membrane protease YdiL (CAAX protease family)
MPNGPTGSTTPPDQVIQARPVATLQYASSGITLPLVKEPPAPEVLPMGSMFALLILVGTAYIGAMMLAGGTADEEQESMALEIGITAGQWIFFMILPLAVVAGARSNLRMTFNWYRPRLDLFVLTLAMTLCIVGIVQYVDNFAMVYLADAYDKFFGDLLPKTAERLEETSRLFEAETPAQLVLILLLAAVTPAVCEEHFFRGVVQSSLVRRIGGPLAVIIVASVFSAFHLEPVTFIPLLLMGLVLGLVTWRSNCLAYACWFHFANNGMSVLLQNLVMKDIGAPEEAAGSFDSLPIYLFGVVLGVLVFVARTPRLTARWAHGGTVSDELPTYRPGRWDGQWVWLARRWKWAAIIVALCSITGLALDVRDLKDIAAKSTTRPAEEQHRARRKGIKEHRREGVPRPPQEEEEEGKAPSIINVNAGDQIAPLPRFDGRLSVIASRVWSSGFRAVGRVKACGAYPRPDFAASACRVRSSGFSLPGSS